MNVLIFQLLKLYFIPLYCIKVYVISYCIIQSENLIIITL